MFLLLVWAVSVGVLTVAALEEDLAYYGHGGLALLAVGVIAGSWILGILFTRTLRAFASGWWLGALIAAGIAAFTGQAVYIPLLLVNAVAGGFASLGLRSRLEAEMVYRAERHYRAPGSPLGDERAPSE